MLWRGNRKSENIEYRRGSSGTTRMVGGGIGTLILVAVVYFLGGDPNMVLNQQIESTNSSNSISATDSSKEFVSTILASTEDVWSSLLPKFGYNYKVPALVLFSNNTHSGCGGADAATGPFYCPADSKVYLDLSFFNELKHRFRVEGNFAHAYIIAHEVGHHIQNLLGINREVSRLQSRAQSEAAANKWSVKQELQADFLAGVWAHYAKSFQLTENDIISAINAASAVGDDKIQAASQGYVVPDAFTHGTAKQRVEWFLKGYKTGDLDQGDTFNDPNI